MAAQDNLLNTPLVDSSRVTHSHNPSDSVGGSHSDPPGIASKEVEADSRKGLLSYAQIVALATGDVSDAQPLGRPMSRSHLRQEQAPAYTSKLGGKFPSEGKEEGEDAIQIMQSKLALVDASRVTDSYHLNSGGQSHDSHPSGTISEEVEADLSEGLLSYAQIQATATGDVSNRQLLGPKLTSVHHLKLQEQDQGETRYSGTLLPKLGERCPSEGQGKGKAAVQNIERELPASFCPSSSREIQHELDFQAELPCGDEPEPPQETGRSPPHTLGKPVERGGAEQLPGDKLNHLYNELSLVVPNGSMLDKASLLGAAAAYILELQGKIKAEEMRTEVEGSANPNVVTPASSALQTLHSHDSSGISKNLQAEHLLEDKPIVNIDFMGREAIVRVIYSEDGRNVHPLLISTLRNLQMKVHHATTSMVKNRGYHMIFAEMDEAKILSEDEVLGAVNRSLGSLRPASEQAYEEDSSS